LAAAKFFMAGYDSEKFQGTSGNSIIVMIARHFRADDCMDAGGRATQDAKAE